MQRIVLIAIASAILAFGQGFFVPYTPVIPPQLKNYLQLTKEQEDSITRLNRRLNQFRAEKAQRQGQVQGEIREETARETLDAMALGLRYLELEGIQRELQAEQRKTLAEVQKLMTPAQTTKLQALREVLNMYGTACAAIDHNMVPSPPAFAGMTGSRSGDFAGLILNSMPRYAPCGGNTITGFQLGAPAPSQP